MAKNCSFIFQPVYTSSKNDVEESHAYSSLLAGLQKTPIVPNTYSGLPLNTNAVQYSSLYTSTIGAAGYPASTWPLSRAPIVKNVGVTPYINGLFGFGALKNKVIRKYIGTFHDIIQSMFKQQLEHVNFRSES